MKRILILLLVILIKSESLSCSCNGKANILKEYNISDVVIVGKVINRREVSFWRDTSFARKSYDFYIKENKEDKSYSDFINQSKWKRTKIAYTILVQENFKGANTSDTLRILTGSDGGDCGYNFQIDHLYLIYAINITKDMINDLS